MRTLNGDGTQSRSRQTPNSGFKKDIFPGMNSRYGRARQLTFPRSYSIVRLMMYDEQARYLSRELHTFGMFIIGCCRDHRMLVVVVVVFQLILRR